MNALHPIAGILPASIPAADLLPGRRESFCTACRHEPCACVALCHGCDRLLDQSRYCPDCEEVMPTYLHPVARQTDLAGFKLPERADRRRHGLGRVRIGRKA